MDSESPHAFGIAGRERRDTGTPFTSDARGFESEFRFGSGRDRDAAGRRLPGPHPCRRRVDGDGP